MRSCRAVGLAVLAWLGAAAPPATALTLSTSANPADGWRATAPVGDLAGQPLSAVGLAWEASHPGWNTSLAFDDSDAAGWHPPVARDLTRYGFVSTNNIWADDPQGSGDTPAYFRLSFTLDFEPGAAHFGGQSSPIDGSNVIDDDVQIYLNGVLVYDDQDGLSGFIPFTDVTPYLQAGENLIAVKAHDSVGIDEHLSLALVITQIPEPGPLALVALGVAAFGWRARRARGRRHRASSI